MKAIQIEDGLNHEEFSRTFHQLLDNLVPVLGCTDRYVIYSERENLVVVAAMNPQKPDGAFTVIKVQHDYFVSFPSWKMPGLIVTALRSQLTNFVNDVRKRTHANL